MNPVLPQRGVDCNSGGSGYAISIMQLEVIRTFPQWLGFARSGTTCYARSVVRVPFLRHEFLSAWWAHLGGCNEWPHGELYVVLARESDRLIAAAPLFASVDGEQDPVLALIGSDAMADYLDLLAEPAFVAAFVEALLDHLMSPDAPSASLALGRFVQSSRRFADAG